MCFELLVLSKHKRPTVNHGSELCRRVVMTEAERCFHYTLCDDNVIFLFFSVTNIHYCHVHCKLLLNATVLREGWKLLVFV